MKIAFWRVAGAAFTIINKNENFLIKKLKCQFTSDIRTYTTGRSSVWLVHPAGFWFIYFSVKYMHLFESTATCILLYQEL
jgi:hypothetical protein